MTLRACFFILLSAFCLLCALSTAAGVFFLLFWFFLVMLLLGAVSCVWSARSMQISSSLDASTVVRGGQVTLEIYLKHSCPLPVSPVLLKICGAGENGLDEMCAQASLRGCMLHLPLLCPHVGSYPAGVTAARVSDLFGLFSMRCKVPPMGEGLVVLPQVYEVPSLRFSPGESENERVTRAFEDATLPTDVRPYQNGDELKKVHWKLSMRRRELMVRTYEQPARSDVLLLLDCTPPTPAMGSEALCRDLLAEAAASVSSAALGEGAPVRMPLLGSSPLDLSVSRTDELPQVLAALGRCAFDADEQFERVLLLETRRMRRTGATSVFTSRMNPVIADLLLRIRRMGPQVRVHLAADPQNPDVALAVRRLMRNDIEVIPLFSQLSEGGDA